MRPALGKLSLQTLCRISRDFLFRRGRLGAFYWIVNSLDFRRHCSTVHKFIDKAVHEALSVKYDQDGKKSNADVHCFLDALIKETRDPRVLRDQLLNVLLAGRDTTACCLTWVLYVICVLSKFSARPPLTNLPPPPKKSRLLAQHRDVLAKLRHEISSTVGVGIDASLPDRNMLKRMKYLNLVLKEGTTSPPPFLP